MESVIQLGRMSNILVCEPYRCFQIINAITASGDDGYVEMPGFNLTEGSQFGFTFQPMKSDGLLMISTFLKVGSGNKVLNSFFWSQFMINFLFVITNFYSYRIFIPWHSRTEYFISGIEAER